MTGWECPRCGLVWAPTVQTCTCTAEATSGTTWRGSRDPELCPCNPARGGSGVCGCVLSGARITCTLPNFVEAPKGTFTVNLSGSTHAPSVARAVQRIMSTRSAIL